MSERFTVAVMGQTGVGKSSLINALFDTKLPTSAHQPATREVTRVSAPLVGGGVLDFVDLPGIGEAAEADERYLAEYVKYLEEADTVLWAIHADSRSVTFDRTALDRLFRDFGSDPSPILGKITFLLTKADLLNVPPWIFSLSGDKGVFAPDDKVAETLRLKEEYVHRVFVQPYRDVLTPSTYNDENFSSRGPFKVEGNRVIHRGLVSAELATEYTRRYPDFADLFARLRDSYRVIPCSALFRYNFTELLVAIENKLGPTAVGKFKDLTIEEHLDYVSASEAKALHNIVIVDRISKKLIFDLAKHEIGGLK